MDDDGNGGDHATTGGAAAAGAVTGGVIGVVGGPIGVAAGAIAGGAVGAVIERIMHGAEGHQHIEGDEEHWTGDHEHTGEDDGHDHRFHYEYSDTATAQNTAPPTEARREETTRVPVREERLVTDRRVVESGEVEVRKDVVEERRDMSVPRQREEVHVERRPVDRPAEGPVGEEQTIRVPVREEVVEVRKEPVVREEVEISKTRVTEQQPVNATLKREEVHIDRPDWSQASDRYRRQWEATGNRSGRWEDYEPGYRFAYEMYGDPRYRGRSWDEVAPEFRSNWDTWSARHGYRTEPNAWDRLSNRVREAWMSMRD